MPLLARRFVRWVIGEEQSSCLGTVGVCHCRPTARRARQVFGVLRWILYTQDLCAQALLRVRAYLVGLKLHRR